MKSVTSFIVENPYLVGSWCLILFLVIINECRAYTKSVYGLTPQQAIDLINHEHAVVLDLRAPHDFERGHIIKALRISINNEVELKKVLKQKKLLKKPLILVCQKGKRAQLWVAKLVKEGYKAFFLQGGLASWQEEGLPLIKRRTTVSNIKVYSKEYCPYCDRAKDLLTSKQVTFEEIRVDQDQEQLKLMMQLSGRKTVPQIFIGERHIGGFDDLKALNDKGDLDPLLGK